MYGAPNRTVGRRVSEELKQKQLFYENNKHMPHVYESFTEVDASFTKPCTKDSRAPSLALKKNNRANLM